MKQAEAYLRAVRRGLKDAPAEDRERLMKRLTEAVSAYLEEEPEAGEADIVKAFGTPEACAAELLEECDPVRVAETRRKRRLLYAVIAVLAAAALVVVAVLAFRGGSGAPQADSFSPGGYGHHGVGHHG